MSFFSKNNAVLGVDIGTSNIKVVQVTPGNPTVLNTYGMVNIAYQLVGKNDEKNIAKAAETLRMLLQKSGVTTNKCVISFPNSAVFTSVIEMPRMKEQELSSAVEFEAKKYVPLALSEIDLQWSIISDADPSSETVKVLLTAVPKQITENYKKLFALAKLDPIAGEIEALALIRSLIGNAPVNCVIMDIGAKSTSLNMIENGVLRLSRNLNIGGDTITNRIAESLNISFGRAEQFKKDFGIATNTFIPETIKPILNIIKTEIKQLLTIYQSHGTKVEKLILVGGGASLPGISEYFKDLQIVIELGSPLQALAYNKNIEPLIGRYALNLPVAIGLALRNET